MADAISFTTRAGKRMAGVRAATSGDSSRPGVVLIHEYWGLNAHIGDIADRFAAEGFLVVAPDLFDGQIATDEKAASALMKGLDWAAAIDKIGGAIAVLRRDPRCNGSVGVVGFCLGGALTFAAAAKLDNVAAIVPFYGLPDPTYSLDRLTAKVQAHFCAADEWATQERAKALQAQLTERGKSMELFVYDAKHAFMNNTRPEVFDPEAAKLAWGRAVQFLRDHLVSTAASG